MKNKTLIAGLIIVVLHLVGAIGTAIDNPFQELIISLTPINLLISAILLFYTSTNKDRVAIFLLFSYLIGFGAEWLGVNTGLIFGEYEYGIILGPKFSGVPLIIGINWFILAYASGSIINKLKFAKIIKVLLGASLMTLVDVLIEPVAISLGYWQWGNDSIPVSNFIGWWAISFVILYIFYTLLHDETNGTSRFLIISQIFYFTIVLLFF